MRKVLKVSCDLCKGECKYMSAVDSPGFIYEEHQCQKCGHTHVIPVIKDMVDLRWDGYY